MPEKGEGTMLVDNTAAKDLERFYAQPAIHKHMLNKYRVAANEKFFERAFDYLTQMLNVPANATFLDAGCGSCAHSLRLARRGYLVHAIDFSAYILSIAKARVHDGEFTDRVSVNRSSLLALPFRSESFDHVLCWGVLMHIPDIEQATRELTRVLKPGGVLIIGENNMHSLQSILRLILNPILKKSDIRKRPSGMEYWRDIPDEGRSLTRQTNIGWLVEHLSHQGLFLKKRIAGQFTDLYTKFSWPWLRNVVHFLNNLWFDYIKIPQPAVGNILIFQKKYFHTNQG